VLIPWPSTHPQTMLAPGTRAIPQGGPRPDAHRTGHIGQPSPIDPVIGPILMDASGIVVVGQLEMDIGYNALLCGDGLTGVSRVVYAWG